MPEVCEWVPIAESGAEFTFDAPDGLSALVGSTVTSSGANSWSLTLTTADKVRVTYADFENTSDPGALPDARLSLLTPAFEAIASIDAAVGGPALSGTVQGEGVGIVQAELVQASEFSQSFAGTFLVEVEVCGPAPGDECCPTVGRATTAYVSAYQRARVHRSRVYRYEARCLQAELRGVLGEAVPSRSVASERIVRAEWRVAQPWCVALSEPKVCGSLVDVQMEAILSGEAVVKMTAYTDRGRALTQLYVVRVMDQPWFQDEPVRGSGPTIVVWNEPE